MGYEVLLIRIFQLYIYMSNLCLFESVCYSTLTLLTSLYFLLLNKNNLIWF